MEFKDAWQFLKAVEPKVCQTKTGESFEFFFRKDSIVFLPRGGKGKEKPQSVSRFKEFFIIYFIEGKRAKTDFRNRGGEGSPSGIFSYFMPLFHMLEECELTPFEVLFSSNTPNNDSFVPERTLTESYRFKRDTKQGRWLKALYEGKCQLCEYTIKLPNGRHYAEAHHIRPLGGGHNGADIATNIIVLCPNHHVLLDFGVEKMEFNKIIIRDGHRISQEFVEYHNREIYNKTR